MTGAKFAGERSMSLFAPLSASPFPSSSFGMPSLDTLPNADPNDSADSFGASLQNAFAQVNTLQNHAADMTKAFAAGQTSDIHSVIIASEQATIALQLTTQVRNKAIEAYQEIMRTAV